MSMLEYALLAALIAGVCVIAVGNVRYAAKKKFEDLADFPISAVIRSDSTQYTLFFEFG